MIKSHPHTTVRPVGENIHLTVWRGDIRIELFLGADQARLLAAQLQAAANAVTAAPVIHQREAVQP